MYSGVPPVGNNYPRVVETLAAGIACDVSFVGFSFGGRGAHGSLDLVEESEPSYKHTPPNQRHSAVRGANRANYEIYRSANLRPTYRKPLGRIGKSEGVSFHEISRSYSMLSSIGPQDGAHAAARTLEIQDFKCKRHDVFFRGLGGACSAPSGGSARLWGRVWLWRAWRTRIARSRRGEQNIPRAPPPNRRRCAAQVDVTSRRTVQKQQGISLLRQQDPGWGGRREAEFTQVYHLFNLFCTVS